MKDVAELAGVSLGTVSNVLNGLSSVSDENCSRVNDAVQKLNYRPNHAARTLKTKKSKSIGLLIPEIENPFYAEFARGVEDELNELGYNIFLCNSDRNPNKERNYIHVLLEKNVDGIILYKSHMTAREIGDYQKLCPIVLVDMYAEQGYKCDIINVDDYKGTWTAVSYLWEYGHRKIAMIAGGYDSVSSMQRVKAYRDFYAGKDYKVDDYFIRCGSYSCQSGYDCASDLFLMQDKPTAVFCANDMMAIGTIKALREKKIDIPRDVSVVGYDDINMASLCIPALTTVRQPKYELGILSAQYVVKRCEGDTSDPLTVSLETKLIVRDSVCLSKEGQQKQAPVR